MTNPFSPSSHAFIIAFQVAVFVLMGNGKSVNHLFWDQSLPYLMDMLNIKLQMYHAFKN